MIWLGQYIEVEVTDLTWPTISFTGDDTIKVLVGGVFPLPSDYAILADNYETNTLASNLTISGARSCGHKYGRNYSNNLHCF